MEEPKATRRNGKGNQLDPEMDDFENEFSKWIGWKIKDLKLIPEKEERRQSQRMNEGIDQDFVFGKEDEIIMNILDMKRNSHGE